MKAVIDTSSLFKKYVQEPGSDELESHLESLSEIVVAPTYWLEMHSVAHRRVKANILSAEESKYLIDTAKKDLDFFHKVNWDEELESVAVGLIKKHQLQTLDSIQLASCILSMANVFITSDKYLMDSARREIKKVVFI